MSFVGLLLCMIFCHIVDDYYLQGWLASAKQKKWWENNSPDEIYKYDYIWALIMHSFSWTFMIMLPIMILDWFHVGFAFMVMFVFNWMTHAIIDTLKANVRVINLWQDQLVHIIQIIFTAVMLWYW